MQYNFTFDEKQAQMILSAIQLKIETWDDEIGDEPSAAQRQIGADIASGYRKLFAEVAGQKRKQDEILSSAQS